MTESKSSFCYADERHALIIGNSKGGEGLKELPEVYEDVKTVEEFAKKHKFTSITILHDSEASKAAVVDFFAREGVKAYEHA